MQAERAQAAARGQAHALAFQLWVRFGFHFAIGLQFPLGLDLPVRFQLQRGRERQLTTGTYITPVLLFPHETLHLVILG